MTEQEKKEIEEMAKELHCATNESFIDCRKIARILVERCGYRKADDVRKETLKEVFKELSSYKTIMNFDIVDLSKKYGIELEKV